MSTKRTDPYLRIRGLTKRFGDFAALRDVDLDIWRGDLVCFLGPSGCGKTTLLRAIAGLDLQTEGSIHQDRRDISNLPPDERDFGIVFQSYALFPNLTVAKNIAYGLVSQKRPKRAIRTRVEEMLDLIGLPGSGRKYPTQLSGGQQQRIALARALAPEPGLLLLDEPLSALDAKVRAHLRGEIRRLQQRLGVTTIMVTHDQQEAMSIADQVVVLIDGQVQQVGAPQTIYLHPDNRAVADFIGSMNAIPCCFQEGDGLLVGGRPFCGIDTAGFDEDIAGILVRPEHLAIKNKALNGTDTIPVRILAIEFLGGHSHIAVEHLSDADIRLTLSLPSDQVRKQGLVPAQRIALAMDIRHCHLTDAAGVVRR